MADDPRGNPVTRAVRAVTAKDWAAKAKGIATALRAEHAAGLRGDDSPAQPVWPTPKQQLEAIKQLFRSRPQPQAELEVHSGTVDADAGEVAEALRGVDWAEVRAAATERTNDVARTMRAMADHVDWAKVQPVAAQVSSALIAAVAAGRIPVGGRLGPIVARAITDQNNLGAKVAQNLHDSNSNVPSDFGEIIETTARE